MKLENYERHILQSHCLIAAPRPEEKKKWKNMKLDSPHLEDGPRNIPPQKFEDLMDLLPLIFEGRCRFQRNLETADHKDDDYIDEDPSLSLP